jgi:hypothetical protein
VKGAFKVYWWFFSIDIPKEMGCSRLALSNFLCTCGRAQKVLHPTLLQRSRHENLIEINGETVSVSSVSDFADKS